MVGFLCLFVFLPSWMLIGAEWNMRICAFRKEIGCSGGNAFMQHTHRMKFLGIFVHFANIIKNCHRRQLELTKYPSNNWLCTVNLYKQNRTHPPGKFTQWPNAWLTDSLVWISATHHSTAMFQKNFALKALKDSENEQIYRFVCNTLRWSYTKKLRFIPCWKI